MDAPDCGTELSQAAGGYSLRTRKGAAGAGCEVEGKSNSALATGTIDTDY